MRNRYWRCGLWVVAWSLLGASAEAGGAWVPEPGRGFLYLGASRKTADSSWNAFGDAFTHLNASGQRVWHDFRYVYLSGEIGVAPRLALTFTGTWLDGREGTRPGYEQNKGLSEAFVGAKYQFRRGAWPMALAFNHRTPVFYDLPGAYNRHLFDSSGQFRGVSPEWRGLLKRDYSLSLHVSRSVARHRGWTSVEAGHTWREGAPANQLFAAADVGYPLPWLRSHVKLAGAGQWTVGDFTTPQPDDRFRGRADYNFNEAGYAKLGASWLVPLGAGTDWVVEVGYARWVWGRSARRYGEPYLSLGRSF